MTTKRAALVFSIALACEGSQQDDFQFEDLEGKCTIKCEFAIGCDGETDEVSLRKCIGECIQFGEDSLDVGSECAEAYDHLLVCFELLSCEGFHEWAYMAMPRPCGDETDAFTPLCPGVWFVPDLSDV